jgi:hypothetical protein
MKGLTTGQTECSRCGAVLLPAYVERHAARPDRQDASYRQAAEGDARANAAYGPVRPPGQDRRSAR